MRIGLVYERKEWFPFTQDDPADLNSELLSAEEEEEIVRGLREAGHEVVCIGDVSRLLSNIPAWKRSCDIVLNRSVGYRGTERKSMAADVLEAAQIPYVGSTPYVLSLTRNKYHCKMVVADAGLPTPSAAMLHGGLADHADRVAYPAIVKPVAESSSIGIEMGLAVVQNAAAARERAGMIAARYHQPAIVESFIEGIELEVPMIADDAGCMRVLGISAVAVNSTFPAGLQYLASDSVYDDNYDYIDPPAHIDLHRVTALAECGAAALGMRDYGRMDFRIDAAGNPWFIEASTHPHVQVHSSFCHAARQHSLSYSGMLNAVIQAGVHRYPASVSGGCVCQR
jgi:D-alanine-D-alanine ligase